MRACSSHWFPYDHRHPRKASQKEVPKNMFDPGYKRRHPPSLISAHNLVPLAPPTLERRRIDDTLVRARDLVPVTR